MASFEYDLIVIGSGISGLSSAFRLRDEIRILVLDQGPLGGGTSSRASGVITPAVDYADMPAWADHACVLFREFDGRGLFNFVSRPHIKPVRPDAHEHARERPRARGFPCSNRPKPLPVSRVRWWILNNIRACSSTATPG